MDIVERAGDIFGGDDFELGFEGGEDDISSARNAGDVEDQRILALVSWVNRILRRVGREVVDGGEGAGLHFRVGARCKVQGGRGGEFVVESCRSEGRLRASERRGGNSD